MPQVQDWFRVETGFRFMGHKGSGCCSGSEKDFDGTAEQPRGMDFEAIFAVTGEFVTPSTQNLLKLSAKIRQLQSW